MRYINRDLLNKFGKVVNSGLIKGADMLEDELEDWFEALGWELHGEDGLEVEGTLNALEFNVGGGGLGRFAH